MMTVKPLNRARQKGRQACRDGVPLHACPYRDIRTPSGHVTWSRAFINEWIAGWQETDRDRS